jgi:hypothetical protein
LVRFARIVWFPGEDRFAPSYTNDQLNGLAARTTHAGVRCGRNPGGFPFSIFASLYVFEEDFRDTVRRPRMRRLRLG